MNQAKTGLWIHKSVLLLSAIILSLAAACGPGPTPIIITLPTATESVTTISQSPATQPAATEAPAISPTPFVPTARIKIFAHVPLTGQAGFSGQDIVHGAQLAVKQLSGPINANGYQVEVTTYDDQGIVAAALANAQKIVADPEILCGVGHYDSEITLAASDVYHQAGLAFVSPSVTTPLLTSRNYLEVNRLIGRVDRQGAAAAQFAQAQGYTSAFIVTQKSENNLRNAEFFRGESGKLGIKWLGTIMEDINDQSMNRLVSKIMSANPDLVYVSASASESVPLLARLRAEGYLGAILGTERLNSRSNLTAGGPSLLQGAGLYYTVTIPPVDYYPDAAQFRKDFYVEFGSAPLSVAARAYDATGMCLKAIEDATKAAGGIPSRAQVANALRALKDYQGITGTYSFNTHGDLNPMQYYVLQVTSVDSANWDLNPIVASYHVAAP